MDWKEKGIEATYLGFLAIAGSWVVKKFKPFQKGIVKLSKLSSRVDEIEKRLLEEEIKRVEWIKGLETRIAIDENTIRAIFDNSIIPTFMLNDKFEVNYVNTAWLDLMGFSSDEEAYGIGYLKAIPIKHRAEMQEQMDNSKEHPSRVSDTMVFRNAKSGKEFPMYCRSTPIYDYKNHVAGTLGFLYPI